MATLLLRLAGPMQSWGDESKYEIRGTRREPTKSGVIGLLASALGLKRDSNEIKNMAESLRMGVRVDQPGTVVQDFHTARAPKYGSDGFAKYDKNGDVVMDSSYVTYRYYLCDGVFLVGIESEDFEFLTKMGNALHNPAFPLYLGRRSCPVTLPLNLGIIDKPLEEALKDTLWLASEEYKKKRSSIVARILIETKRGQISDSIQMDQPVSYNPIHRKFTTRGMNKEQRVILGIPEHDPMGSI